MLGFPPDVAPSLEQQLVLCLLSPRRNGESLPAQIFRQVDWTRWLQFAQQELRGYLYYSITSHHLDAHFPPHVLHLLKNASDAGTLLHLRRISELRKIAAAFQSDGIEFLLVKGIALANMVYPRPSTRFMADMDLLVRPDNESRAFQLAQQIGYKVAERHAPKPIVVSSDMHLPALHIPGMHVLLEIHSSIQITNTPEDVEALFARSVEIDVSSATRLRTLAPRDFLLHIAAHAVEHHLFEIGLSCVLDVALFCEAFRDRLSLRPDHSDVPSHVLYASLLASLASEMLEVSLPAGMDAAFTDHYPELKQLAISQLWIGTDRDVPPGAVELMAQGSLPARLVAAMRRVFLAACKGRLMFDLRTGPAKLFRAWRQGAFTRKKMEDRVAATLERKRIAALLAAAAWDLQKTPSLQ